MNRFKPLRKILGGRSSAEASRPVVTVAERFLEVFRAHGVESSQIPRLLPQVTLADLQTPDRLLAVLNPATLDQAAGLFGIRVEWLEGRDDEIYPCLVTGKEPQILLRHLAAILPSHRDDLDFPLRVLTSAERLCWKRDELQELVPVLVEPIATLGESTVCRYHVYCDGFTWDHEPARVELKAIARIAYKALGKPIPLYLVTRQELEEVMERRRFPRDFVERPRLTNPSLEDYAESVEVSVVAKEWEELPEVLRYIDSHRLLDIELVWQAAPEALASAGSEAEPPAAPAPAPAKPAGKRDASNADWASIQNYARARWAEEPAIGIADMIERIQTNKKLRKPAMGESAIRKRIAEFAPPEARKAGRRPKKSP